MNFRLVSPISFEPWDWRNSVEKGIGGSETSTVENAWRLAARGHDVVSYNNIPEDCPGEWRGTRWKKLEQIDFSEPGVWVLYRCPELVDRFDRSRKDQVLWLMMQDWDYSTFTPARVAKLDRILVICNAHRDYMIKKHPDFEHKLWVSRNGLKLDMIEELEKSHTPLFLESAGDCTECQSGTDKPCACCGKCHKWQTKNPLPRNPRRIMYASSPDRGLKSALLIYQRAKEHVPDLELHITYGFDNCDKLIERGNKALGFLKEECMALIQKTGAKMHGRISQNQLYREWFKTGINVYCTDFFESGWISGVESMAMGAIPVISPIYCQGEITEHGVGIHGPPDDPLTISKFAVEVAMLAKDAARQEKIRQEMMPAVRKRFDWNNFVTGWCEAAEEDFAKAQNKTVFLPAGEPKSQMLSISVITASIRPEGLKMVRDSLKRQGFDSQQFEWLVGTPLVDKSGEFVFSKVPVRFLCNRVLLNPESPAKPVGHYYNLNKSWNQLISSARGRLLVFLSDYVWLPDNTLELLWEDFQKMPKACVSGIGHHYKEIVDGKPEERWWTDPRLWKGGSDIRSVTPNDMEFQVASVPAEAVWAVGGFDEEYDKVAALSEKDLCNRMELMGYSFWLDRRAEYRSWTHTKQEGWDEAYKKAKTMYKQHCQQITTEGHRHVSCLEAK